MPCFPKTSRMARPSEASERGVPFPWAAMSETSPGTSPATAGAIPAGTSAVTRPTPERAAACAAKAIAPAYPAARRLAATGGWNQIEFSTYYKNSESIGITAAEGFEVVERFSLVWKHRPSAGDGFSRIDFPRAELDCYPAHVPFGWRFPLDCPETREWLASRCSAWEFDGARFYHREGGWDFTLLRSGLQNPLEAAQGISRVAAALGMDDGFEVIIPEGYGDALQAFLDSGFVFWEEPHEPNMLVFRLRGSG
jgi:hypothetical protein